MPVRSSTVTVGRFCPSARCGAPTDMRSISPSALSIGRWLRSRLWRTVSNEADDAVRAGRGRAVLPERGLITRAARASYRPRPSPVDVAPHGSSSTNCLTSVPDVTTVVCHQSCSCCKDAFPSFASGPVDSGNRSSATRHDGLASGRRGGLAGRPQRCCSSRRPRSREEARVATGGRVATRASAGRNVRRNRRSWSGQNAGTEIGPKLAVGLPSRSCSCAVPALSGLR